MAQPIIGAPRFYPLNSTSSAPSPPPKALVQRALIQNPYPDSDDGIDDELRAFFPTKITFMDLSSLKLKKVPPHIPVPLLIRQEYAIITSMLSEQPEGKLGSVVISGQPGIGEPRFFFRLDLTKCGMP